jgi:phosphatidylinositol kinase/protein kinase (PI-3  family)
VAGFFRSIALSTENSLQDALRLLTLWFRYGKYIEVNEAVQEGFKSVSIDTWLQVIPQLIARIDTPIAHVRRLIHQVFKYTLIASFSRILEKSIRKLLSILSLLLQNLRLSVVKKLHWRSRIICGFIVLRWLNKRLLSVKS